MRYFGGENTFLGNVHCYILHSFDIFPYIFFSIFLWITVPLHTSSTLNYFNEVIIVSYQKIREYNINHCRTAIFVYFKFYIFKVLLLRQSVQFP